MLHPIPGNAFEVTANRMKTVIFGNRLLGLRHNRDVDQDPLTLKPVGREAIFLVTPCSVRDRTPRRRPQGEGANSSKASTPFHSGACRSAAIALAKTG